MGGSPIILIIFAIVFSFFILVGFVQEKKIQMEYKRVFNRITSYFFTAGIGGTVFAVLSLTIHFSVNDLPYIIIACIFALAISFLIGLITYRKCPFTLRKKLFISMFLAGAGVVFKVGIFIIPWIWSLPLLDQQRAFPYKAYDFSGHSCTIYEKSPMNYWIKRADGSESPIRHAGRQLIDDDSNYYYY